MSYREKIEKYKKNQLTEEERKSVENEIEKAEAINEYLTEQLENDPIFENRMFESKTENDSKCDIQNSQEELQFEKYVKKSIHKIFRKVALGTGTVLLVILLFVQFGLSPMISFFYYNPARQIKIEMESDDETGNWEASESQLGIDLRVYAEITMPCRSTDNIQVFPQGYGKYTFQIIPAIGYDAQKRIGTAGQINRGKMETYIPEYFSGRQDNYFIAYGMDRNLSFREQIENSVKEYDDYTVSSSQWYYASLEEAEQFIDNLEEEGFYYAYVSFDRPLSFDEVNVLMDKLQNNVDMMGQPWIGVYTSEGSYGRTLGYDYENTTWGIPSEYNKSYPELSLFGKNSYSDEVYKETQEKLKNEKSMTQHMSSMLRYLSDQKQFMNMMEEESRFDTNWKLAADYIEENGLSSYGFVCVTTKTDMQKMLKEEHVLGIVAENWK